MDGYEIIKQIKLTRRKEWIVWTNDNTITRRIIMRAQNIELEEL